MQLRLRNPIFLILVLIGPNRVEASTPSSSSPLSSTTVPSKIRKFKFWRNTIKKNKNKNKKSNTSTMGKVVRVMRYDRAENERNAIPALTIASSTTDSTNSQQQQQTVDGRKDDDNDNDEGQQQQQSSPPPMRLQWYRLDDGVMGGQSETLHHCLENGSLHFAGQINTEGGGFCSIRSSPSGNNSSSNSNSTISNPNTNNNERSSLLPPGTTAIRLRIRGDGKTYKLLLSDGTRSSFGPSKRNPSWQCDIPTKKKKKQNNNNNNEASTEEEDFDSITIPLSSLTPSWGPRRVSAEEIEAAVHSFDVNTLQEIGFMLSLKLSDGSNNPIETFGSGIFPFSLQIVSIEPVQ